MKSRCSTCLFRRRPVSPSATQIRQKAERLRDLYELEAVLALSRPTLDINYLLELDLEASYVLDVLASAGGRV